MIPGGRLGRRPVIALAGLVVVTVGPLLDAQVGGRIILSPVCTVAIAIVGYLVGAWLAPVLAAPACLVGALILTVTNQQVEAGRYSFSNDLFFFALLIGGVAMAGSLIGARRRQVHELRRLAAVRAAQRADEISAVEVEERIRLEAEVTQVAMQRMGALVVQAAGARRLDDLEPVRVAAAGMEETARTIIGELRETVGSLRAPIEIEAIEPEAQGAALETDRSGGARRPGRLDLVLAASGVPVAIEMAAGAGSGWAAIQAIAAAAIGVPLLIRRSRPLVATTLLVLIAVGLGAAQTALVAGNGPGNGPGNGTGAGAIPLSQTVAILLPFSLAAHAIGAYARGPGRLAGAALLFAGGAALTVLGGRSATDAAVVPSLVWLAVAMVSGVVAARHEARAEHLRRLLIETETGRDSRLRLAVAEQRQTVARDLHDGVALAVTVVCLQAQAARRERDPGAVRAALEAIDCSAREAMERLREGLQVLENEADLAAEIGAFAGWLGLDASVEIDPGLPTGQRPIVLRVVREALVNVTRHAPGAAVRVGVRIRAGRAEVEVVNLGHREHPRSTWPSGPTGSFRGSGTGLLGLSELVRERGGRLEQGATAAGGFRVAASLPMLIPSGPR